MFQRLTVAEEASSGVSSLNVSRRLVSPWICWNPVRSFFFFFFFKVSSTAWLQYLCFVSLCASSVRLWISPNTLMFLINGLKSCWRQASESERDISISQLCFASVSSASQRCTTVGWIPLWRGRDAAEQETQTAPKSTIQLWLQRLRQE